MAGKTERPRPLREAKDSGIWWVRFIDQDGIERRQKVGPKTLPQPLPAVETKVKERGLLPEAGKKKHHVTVEEACQQYLDGPQAQPDYKTTCGTSLVTDTWQEAPRRLAAHRIQPW